MKKLIFRKRNKKEILIVFSLLLISLFSFSVNALEMENITTYVGVIINQPTYSIDYNSTLNGSFVPYTGATANVNLNNKNLSGFNSIQMQSASATGKDSIALGTSAQANKPYSIAIGKGAIASGNESIALGSSTASGLNSIALGNVVQASGESSMALGVNSYAYNYSSIAIGFSASAENDYAVAIGEGVATGYESYAFGYGAPCEQDFAICFNQENVGVNTGTPLAKFDVNGSSIIQGFLNVTKDIKVIGNITANRFIASNGVGLEFTNPTDQWAFRYADGTGLDNTGLFFDVVNSGAGFKLSNAYFWAVNTSGHITTLGGMTAGDTITTTKNMTAQWFNGRFNWTTNSSYLVFDGSSLGFIENTSWSSTYNATYNTWAYNQTLPAQAYADANMTLSVLQGILNGSGIYSTYNATYDGAVNNASYLSTYNATYANFAYNQTNGAGSTVYVPYTGATGNVDLGNNNLTINNTWFFVGNLGRGRFGIGTSAPTNQLTIVNERTAAQGGGDRHIVLSNNLNAIASSQLIFQRSRGTFTSPTIVNNGDIIGNVWATAYNGSTYNLLNSIGWIVNGTVTATNIPVDTIFTSNPAGTSSSTAGEVMRIKSTGEVGIGTNNPTQKLEVNGTIKTNLTGTGNDYVCVDTNGVLFRSDTAC